MHVKPGKTGLPIIFLLLCMSVSPERIHAGSGHDTLFISRDLQLIRLSERMFVHVSWTEHEQWGRFSSNGLVYVSGNQAFLFDTPMSDELTEQLILFIYDSLNVTLTGFIPNHWHDDCMGGIDVVHRHGIKSYALELTRTIAKENGITVPQFGFQDSLIINFSGLPIECRFFGAGHSMDNIVVWFPSEKILFGGCLIKDLHSTRLGNYVDGDIKAWPVSVQRVMNAYPDARYVIPGHGESGDLSLLSHTLDLLKKHSGK